MRRRDLIALAAGAAALRPLAVVAQHPKIPTIGLLVIPDLQYLGFRQRLRDLGYVDGQNSRLEFRSAKSDLQRLPELAAALVRAQVDVIVAWSTPALLAAQHATSEIPIVMVGPPHPVGAGFVASFARPGGNITGLAILSNAPDPFSKLFLEHARLAADAQRVETTPLMVKAGPELDAAFRAMVDAKVGAVLVQPTLPQKGVADLAIRHRLPTAAPTAGFAMIGGLMSYSGKPQDVERRAAVFVDTILKGAKPADLPVEQPTRFELVINLKTAQALGLTVPPALLARADEVIE